MYKCEWDGPEHRHQSLAEADACIAKFYAEMEREIRRFDNAVPPEFFRDSESPHLAAWHSER